MHRVDITPLLVEMVKQQASDLYVSVDAPPHIKVEGKMRSLDEQPIDASDAHELAYSVMNDDQSKTFEEELELNLALHLVGLGRFRVNLFFQRGEPAMVIRFIKSEIPPIEELGLPPQLRDLIMEERGLVLIVGSTGTGKSTTLASMIDYRAANHTGHILTIEDPVEFVHKHQKALVNQREVGLDTHSYANALKNAMREAPDVILIGEVRDQDTMKHALVYAETGHLCLATLHANNANQAVERILNFFPDTAHPQILMDLSLHLKAIVSQRLCIGKDGKRVPAVEIMINTPYIADLIQKGKVDHIKEAMERSKKLVCQTFDSALYDLFSEGKITEEEALRHADSKNNLALRIRLEKGSIRDTIPLQKEVAFNKTAPYEQYETFRVIPMKVSSRRRSDMSNVLAKGLIHVFEQKGLSHNAVDADIEIQYSFGVKSLNSLELETIDNQNDAIRDDAEDVSEHETKLIINIKDLRHDKSIWRMKAIQSMSGAARKQHEINQDLLELLDEYPPQPQQE